ASALLITQRAFASTGELPSEEVLPRPVADPEDPSEGAPRDSAGSGDSSEDLEKGEGDKSSAEGEKPEGESADEGSRGEAEGSSQGKTGKKEVKNQWAGVPIVGGNSDFGWGGGALVSVTRPNPKNDHSNQWSAELAAVAMFNTESFEPRFQDYYLKAVFDDVLGSGLRLTLRPSFTQVVGVNYYGLGNAATRGGPGLPNPDGEGRRYY